MPTPAQDRVGRGPLAALLILLGLFLASGTGAAASIDLGSPASRLGSTRSGSAAALLPPGTRNPLDDDRTSGGSGLSLLPSEPGIVTERLPARPGADASPSAHGAVSRPAAAPYRARAPPAS